MILGQTPTMWSDYELIDSGSFEKLERFGSYYLIRPEPKAYWSTALSKKEWSQLAHTKFILDAGGSDRSKGERGSWQPLKEMPQKWILSYDKEEHKERERSLNFKMEMRLTAFKHVGLFPEQASNWDYIFSNTIDIAEKSRANREQPPKVLNLFAYTGAASLAARCAGADVTHLDSIKQVVTWARQNMEMSNLENIRWIVEDALKFVKREAKRENLYQGVIMDPPPYGHGPKGEKWILDEMLPQMLEITSKIVAPKDSFFVLNLYSAGYDALMCDSMVKSAFNVKRGESQYGNLSIKDRAGRELALSLFTRLRR